MFRDLLLVAVVGVGLGGPSFTHAAGLEAPGDAPSTVSLVEYYHAGLDHYFITASALEIAALDNGVKKGWSRTGFEFTVFPPASARPGRSPVCRFYGLPYAGLNSHFYSGSPHECAAVATTFSSSWMLESSNVFMVTMPDPFVGTCAPDTVPVYRLFNNRRDANHRYTADLAVRAAMLSRGYVAEGYGVDGVAFCAASDPSAPTLAATMLVTATAPDTFTFSSTATPSPGAAIVSYAWDFGDGARATGSTTSHRYTVTGTYPVVLTVTDNKKALGKASKAVSATVGATAPKPPASPPGTPSTPPTRPPAPTATYKRLSEVASLKPGQWATLSTQDINPVLSSTGSSMNILVYSENMLWDPATRQLLFIGSDHGAPAKFVTYREAENKWVHEPDAPWFAENPLIHGGSAEHGYRQAIEPGVAIYRRPWGTQNRIIWRYDLLTKVWSALPPFPKEIIGATNCCIGLAYFPERKSLIAYSPGAPNNVFEYDTVSKTWRGLAGGLQVGRYHISAEYNPVHKVMLLAGGVGHPRSMHKLDASGVVTRLKDAPDEVELGVYRSIIVADPATGDFLVASGNRFYNYDIVSDTWKTLPPTPVVPTTLGGPVNGAVGVPISTYDVVAFVACGRPSEACKTYLYRHIGGSGTPVIPPPPIVPFPPPTAATLPATTQTYSERCAQPGVVKCVGFDTPVPVYTAAGNVTRATLDTSVKASGGGSLRFEIPGNTPENSSGSYPTNFSDDLSVQFGQGEEFYVQWRQRFSPEMLQNMSGGGWKTIIIGEGDRPGTKVSSCTQLEIVMNNGGWKRLFPHMYHSCGEKDGAYEPLYERVPGPGGGDWKLQNAVPGCLYTNANVPPCIGFKTNQWMTFQVRVRIGNWYKNDSKYYKNSAVELWIAEEGQRSRPAISILNYDFVNTFPEAKYGKVWLLPFNTGKDKNFAHATAYTWYDELIISRHPIADPSP